jgi:hypothetical protein
MKNYRIAKVTDGEFVRFYPQMKFLGLIWTNMYTWNNDYYDGFHSYEEAKKNLCHTIRKPVIEYLDVNCEGLK